MRTFRVFGQFRLLVGAVQQLVLVVQRLADAQEALGPATERLNALELYRHQFEAEVAGILLKAEGKLKAANNAEARERQLKRSYERITDEGADAGEPGTEGGRIVGPLDAEAGEVETVQPLRLDMAPNNKAYALRAKWS